MKNFGDTARSNGSGAFGLKVVISDGPLGVSWQHASETCEFLGDVFALRHARGGADYNDARHAIIYLVNELLENAIKFRVPGAIHVGCSLQDGNFELTVSNDTAPDVASRFQSLIEEITAGDPGELLIERIEANAADESSSGSGLGLLTLMNDYGARLGWNFRASDSGAAVTLSTHAVLTLN
jgi:hypothetical protein